MKGVYILLIEILKKVQLPIKSLGNPFLEAGLWIYIGSAMGWGSTSLEKRIGRHFRSRKKLHWHIDYLLNLDVGLKLAIWAESSEPLECSIVQQLEEHEGIEKGPNGFGSSDCKRECMTHLHYVRSHVDIKDSMMDIFRRLKLEPRVTYNGNNVGYT